MAKSKVQDSSYIDNNMLFGVYKGEYLGLSLNNKKVNRSANVLVIGGTGTGKTFKYIKPNILQENCSMVVTDPSGDIFRSFAPYLLSNGDYARFSIKGGEIEAFRSRVEARRRSLLNQSRYCGDGRIGHGRKKRTEPAAQIADKIARFRDTTNHKYSRALIDYAIKNGCGTIQMEKLTGITSNAEHFLKEWSYFDLQTKIESKAKEAGIKVVYINPKFTSQRCNKCGYIHTDNRPVQARFCCQKCGYEENADYNASQNIGTKHIDVIIEETLKMQCEPEVPTE